MTDNRIGEIKAIQKKIVNAIENGEDVSKLSCELARVRAEIAADAEVQELQKIAIERQVLREKAEAVKVKVQRQGEAIDAFLKARDVMKDKLAPLLEPMRDFARMANPGWIDNSGECYLFDSAGSFMASVKGIPKELLPADFVCPVLEMSEPSAQSIGKAQQALQYLGYCIAILKSFRKGSMQAYTHEADSSLLLDTEGKEIELSCRVCGHEKAKEINKALQDGRSLRDLETEYNIPRSTLSRHKNRCLSLGAVRVVEKESPAASANQTFFHG